MARFYHGKKEHHFRRLVLSTLLFCSIAACFYVGVDSVSSRTKEEQKRVLRQLFREGSPTALP